MTVARFTQLLKDFDVRTEDELQLKLDKESRTLPCMECHKEFPIEQIYFVDDNPYCGRCRKEV